MRLLHKILTTSALLLLGSAAVHAADPIKIGGMFETSGGIASLGNQGYEGAQIAVAQINAKGGINGRPLELVQVNTESDETKSVTAAKRLIERENVTAIVGPHSSGSCLAILDVIQRAEVPMVCNGASVKVAGPANERKWVFSTTITDATLIGAEVKYFKSKGLTKIGLLNPDSAFGVSAREQWEKQLPAAGMALVIQETFNNSDQDMTPQLTKIRGSESQANVIWAAGPVQAIAVKNYRQLGIDKPLMLPNGATDPNLLRLAGDAVNGVIFAASKLSIWEQLPDSDPQKALFKSFVTDFRAKFGRDPTGFAGNGYDSVVVLATAIGKAGTDRAKVRDAIEGLKDLPGTTAIFTYSPTDHYGIQPSTLVMQTMRNRKFEIAK
jgi:branched-chain amino acid transport system substrate-binding protein